MRRLSGFIIIGLLSFGFSSPSLLGANGLINMPTATATKYKNFDAGLNWELLKTPDANGSSHKLEYLFNMGIFDGVEMGFVGDSLNEGAFINLKYSTFIKDSTKYPFGLGVGFTKLASFSETNLYMVVSKRFPNKLGGHFGFNSNLLGSKIAANVMFGLEMFFSDNFTVISDLVGESDLWKLSTGLRLKISETALLNAYLEDLFNTTSDGSTFTIGVSMSDVLQ
jgi:hypothetical protein